MCVCVCVCSYNSSFPLLQTSPVLFSFSRAPRAFSATSPFLFPSSSSFFFFSPLYSLLLLRKTLPGSPSIASRCAGVRRLAAMFFSPPSPTALLPLPTTTAPAVCPDPGRVEVLAVSCDSRPHFDRHLVVPADRTQTMRFRLRSSWAVRVRTKKAPVRGLLPSRR